MKLIIKTLNEIIRNLDGMLSDDVSNWVNDITNDSVDKLALIIANLESRSKSNQIINAMADANYVISINGFEMYEIQKHLSKSIDYEINNLKENFVKFLRDKNHSVEIKNIIWNFNEMKKFNDSTKKHLDILSKQLNETFKENKEYKNELKDFTEISNAYLTNFEKFCKLQKDQIDTSIKNLKEKNIETTNDESLISSIIDNLLSIKKTSFEFVEKLNNFYGYAKALQKDAQSYYLKDIDKDNQTKNHQNKKVEKDLEK